MKKKRNCKQEKKVLRKHYLNAWRKCSLGFTEAVRQWCHTTDTFLGMSGTLFSNVNTIQSMIPEDQENIT